MDIKPGETVTFNLDTRAAEKVLVKPPRKGPLETQINEIRDWMADMDLWVKEIHGTFQEIDAHHKAVHHLLFAAPTEPWYRRLWRRVAG